MPKQYRIRYRSRPGSAAHLLYGAQTTTLQPGVIDNDKPRAIKVLRMWRNELGYETAYLEVRKGNGRWNKSSL